MTPPTAHSKLGTRSGLSFVGDLQAAATDGIAGVGVVTGKLGADELCRHPHPAILDGVKDLPGLVSSLR